MLQMLLTRLLIADAVTQSERAASSAALFLLLLGIGVMGAFAWGGYRLLRREKETPPAYAEFLHQGDVEEVDAEFEGGGR